MANNSNYRGITIQFGADTTSISTALSDIEQQARSFQRELREINNGLRLDPTNTELLRQKYDVLTESINTTSERLNRLQQMQQQVEQQFNSGQIGDAQYRSFQRAVANATAQLNNLTSQRDDVQQLMNQFDEGAENVEELGSSIEQVSSATIAKGQLMADAIKAVVSKFMEVANATKEYRKELSLLETNANNTGNSFDNIKSALRDLNAITGESDSNIETLSNLMRTGFSDSQILEVVESLSGAVISFPDTLKIESLADSLQETLASGKSTGQFNELLNRMSINLDSWNSGLQTAIQSGTEYQYILDTLADTGLSNVNKAYRETNAVIIDAANAQFDLNDALADVGAEVEPIITNIKTMGVEVLNQNLPEIKTSIENVGKALVKLVDIGIEFKELIISSAIAMGTYKASLEIGNLISGVVSAIKAFTTAQQSATTAQQAFNATAAANPYVLMASVITALVLALGSLIAMHAQATNELEKYNAELQESIQQGQQILTTGEAEISLLQQKADKYETLRSKAERTAEEEEQLKNIASELQEILPDNVDVINQKTGAYNNLADAIDMVIAKEKASLKTESLKPQALEAQTQINELEEQLSELDKQKTDFESKLNSAEYADKFKNMTQAQIDALIESEYERIEAEQAELKQAIEDRQAIVDEYMDAYSDPLYSSISSSDSSVSESLEETNNNSIMQAEALIKTLKYQYQMGEISARDYYNTLDRYNQQYYKDNADYLDTYRAYNVEVYNGLKKLQEETFTSDNTDAVTSISDARKSALEAEKEQLEEINKQRQQALDLEQALYDLENARSQKTNRVWYHDRGWVDEVDKQAIANAESNVQQLLSDAEVSKIDSLINALDNNTSTAVKDADAYLLNNTSQFSDLLSQMNQAYSTLTSYTIPDLTTSAKTTNATNNASLNVEYKAGDIIINSQSSDVDISNLSRQIKDEILNSYDDFEDRVKSIAQGYTFDLFNSTLLQMENH